MIKKIAASILLMSICTSAFAGVVYDPILNGTVLTNFAEQFLYLQKQLNKMMEQADLTKKQNDMMEKKNGYGDEWNGKDELWMPESVEDFQDGNYGEYLSDRYNYYNEMFPNNPEMIDSHNESSREREQYEYSAKWNNYSRAAFAKKFDESYATVERINEMIKEANKLESPKQSADFQIRMMGELAKLSQQQTELQALQLHLMTIQLEEVKLSKEHNADFWKYTYGQ